MYYKYFVLYINLQSYCEYYIEHTEVKFIVHKVSTVLRPHAAEHCSCSKLKSQSINMIFHVEWVYNLCCLTTVSWFKCFLQRLNY